MVILIYEANLWMLSWPWISIEVAAELFHLDFPIIQYLILFYHQFKTIKLDIIWIIF